MGLYDFYHSTSQVRAWVKFDLVMSQVGDIDIFFIPPFSFYIYDHNDNVIVTKIK